MSVITIKVNMPPFTQSGIFEIMKMINTIAPTMTGNIIGSIPPV